MWYAVLKRVLPVYIAVHLAFLILTYLATLFTLPNFSPQSLRLYTLVHSWYRWDSGHFVLIATQGYTPWWETAFFSLYPLLERAGALLIGDPFVAGLIVSNAVGLVMLAVLYRLVEEDFDQECASRTVLYLSVFPTAFFFAAGYCAFQFYDPLAFVHAQGVWRRSLRFPWHGAKEAITFITTHSVLSFSSIHNMIDLSAVMLMLILVILCFWKFPRHLWAYSIYAATTYLFFLLVPSTGDHPLESFSRLALEVFPAFIVLAIFGKKQQFHLYYLVLSLSVQSFMLLQFLTGHWIV